MLRKALINLLLWVSIRYPEFMQSTMLKKLIVFGHSKVADKFEEIINKQQDYGEPLQVGLEYIQTNFPPPEKVIDLATGTGFGVFKTEVVLAPQEIHGVDLSTNMLKIAREKVEAEAQAKILFSEQDAADLDYADNSFDLVMVSNAPFYLSEIGRILKPGGLFLLTLPLGGKIVLNNKRRFKEYLGQNNFQVKKIGQVERGVFIISKLK